MTRYDAEIGAYDPATDFGLESPPERPGWLAVAIVALGAFGLVGGLYVGAVALGRVLL